MDSESRAGLCPAATHSFSKRITRLVPNVVVLWFGLLLASVALAQPVVSTVARNAGASAGDWAQPGNVVGPDDDNCANMGAVGKLNLTSNFGFSIPVDATITGVVASTKTGEQSTQDVSIQLASQASVSPPTLIGSPKTIAVPNVGNGACASTIYVDTTPNDLAGWGLVSLSPAVVNTVAFGAVYTTDDTSSVKVDAICMEITYETDDGEAIQQACGEAPPPELNTITVVKTVVGAAPGSDWEFTGSGDIGGAFTLPAGGGFQSFADLDDDTYTITETPKTGYTVSSECFIDDVSVATGGASIDVTVGENDVATCTFTNEANTGTFTVRKIYTDDNTDPVSVTATCTAPAEVTNNPQLTSPSAIFNVTKVVPGETTCTATEAVPEGYEADLADCQDGDPIDGGCAITNSPVSRATFRVTKDFTDDNPNPVEVLISCNTGLPLDQTKMIVEGEFVEFIVNDYDIGELDCDVFEAVPEGYSPHYYAGYGEVGNAVISEDGEGCHFDDVFAGDFTCHIVNEPDPVEVKINKEWVFEGSDGPDGVNTYYRLTLWCDAEILYGTHIGVSGLEAPAGDLPGCGQLSTLQEGPQLGFIYDWCKTFEGNGPAMFIAEVIPEYPDSRCFVDETVYDDAVEVDNGCLDIVVSAGHGDECTITNTVFYEGIPTLDQYGMAVLALLMLGVGFIGFRRFA